MDRFMVHLKNSNYTPKDAQDVLSNSRDLSYGVNSTIRDCRISSKFIEFDISIPKNNLEVLLEKLVSIGKLDHFRHIIEEQIEKNQLIKDGILIMKDFGKVMRLWRAHGSNVRVTKKS
jgi:hypothetical protein